MSRWPCRSSVWNSRFLTRSAASSRTPRWFSASKITWGSSLLSRKMLTTLIRFSTAKCSKSSRSLGVCDSATHSRRVSSNHLLAWTRRWPDDGGASSSPGSRTAHSKAARSWASGWTLNRSSGCSLSWLTLLRTRVAKLSAAWVAPTSVAMRRAAARKTWSVVIRCWPSMTSEVGFRRGIGLRCRVTKAPRKYSGASSSSPASACCSTSSAALLRSCQRGSRFSSSLHT